MFADVLETEIQGPLLIFIKMLQRRIIYGVSVDSCKTVNFVDIHRLIVFSYISFHLFWTIGRL